MLKTEDQCKFVRDAITYYKETIETEINVNEINDYISQNSKNNPKTGLYSLYKNKAQITI